MIGGDTLREVGTGGIIIILSDNYAFQFPARSGHLLSRSFEIHRQKILFATSYFSSFPVCIIAGRG